MKLKEVMLELKKLGSDQTVKIYRNQGADGEMFGVKIADLKKSVTKTRRRIECTCLLHDDVYPIRRWRSVCGRAAPVFSG